MKAKKKVYWAAVSDSWTNFFKYGQGSFTVFDDEKQAKAWVKTQQITWGFQVISVHITPIKPSKRKVLNKEKD